jgi:hypothetical protein
MTLEIIDYEWPFEWFNPLRPHNTLTDIQIAPHSIPKKTPIEKPAESTPDQLNRVEREHRLRKRALRNLSTTFGHSLSKITVVFSCLAMHPQED